MVPKLGRLFGLVGENTITNSTHVSGADSSTAGFESQAVRERDRQKSYER